VTKLRTTLMTATVLAALPLVAQAQPVSGLYVGAGAGLNFMQNMDYTELDDSGHSGTVKGRTGFVGVASAGWGFGNGLRAEVEFGWRDQRIVGASGFSTHGPSYTAGRISTLSAMANVLFDMNIGLNWAYPYIGAGAGYAWRMPHNVHEYHDDKASGKGATVARCLIVMIFMHVMRHAPCITGAGADIRIRPVQPDIHVKQDISHRRQCADTPGGVAGAMRGKPGRADDPLITPAELYFRAQAVAKTPASTGNTHKPSTALHSAGMAGIVELRIIHVLHEVQASAGTDIQAGYWLRLGDQRQGCQHSRRH